MSDGDCTSPEFRDEAGFCKFGIYGEPLCPWNSGKEECRLGKRATMTRLVRLIRAVRIVDRFGTPIEKGRPEERPSPDKPR